MNQDLFGGRPLAPPALFEREEGNIEALRRLELGLSDLPSEDMQAASMAIHDISAHLPKREFPHFQVTVQDPVLPCSGPPPDGLCQVG